MDALAILFGAGLLAGAMNAAEAGPVRWPETGALLSGAVLGGCFGAVVARRMPAAWRRALVISFGAVMTVVFFWRAWS